MDIGSLFAGALLGGLVSWVITDRYHREATKSAKRLHDRQLRAYESQNTLQRFERLLQNAEWQEEMIGNDSVWICTHDRTFQIHRGDWDGGSFSEDWTTAFPDQRNTRQMPIYLKINGNTVKELKFVTGDGGRYLIPLPERVWLGEEPVYYWVRNELPFLATRIIGRFYRCADLEETGRFLGVEIVHQNHLPGRH